MPLDTSRLINKGLIAHADIKQYADLLTGVMADQPVTIANTLQVTGSISGPGSVPTGGATSQVLAKTSATNYAVGWTTLNLGVTLPLGQPLTFSPDATYDIGASAASRPRDLFLGRNATVAGTLAVTGQTSLGATTLAASLLFSPDNTYDVGIAGASRPRTVYAATSFVGPGAVPAGGTVGQVLQKSATADYNVAWAAQSGGITLPLGQPLTFSPDSAYDIGASGSSRPRDVWVGGKLMVAGASLLPRSTGTLGIEAPSQYLMLSSLNGTHVNGNCYWDGVNWQRWSTAVGSAVWYVTSNGVGMTAAPAGTGNVPLTGKLTIDLNGTLIFTGGGAISDYGSSYVAINNLTVTPGALAAATINCNGPLNNAAIAGSCTIADGVQHQGWMRMNGPAGIYNTTYGIGIQFTDGVAPRFYSGTYSGELMQSRGRHDTTHRIETGGNVTLNYTTTDGGCINTGSYVYLPDLNYAYGRVMWVKNMTGAAFNVYVTNGNGIYSTGWVNPYTLQQGESITVFASAAYVGWLVI
jgi:hypothetical protein